MSTKFEVEKFTGSNDFGLWKMKMKAVLVKEGLDVALEGEEHLPETMDVRERRELLKKAYSSIILGLGDKVLREVSRSWSMTADVWRVLEERYMAKSVPNRINLKQRLYGFKMKEGKC